MFKLKKILTGSLTAIFVVGMMGASANAEVGVLDPSTLGSVLVLPWETDRVTQSKLTIGTITNVSDEPITLHLVILDETWDATNFDCPLTPSETTYFIFSFDDNRGTSRVETECSRLGLAGPNPGLTSDPVTRTLRGDRGIMFVSVECQKGIDNCPGGTLGLRTRGINALLGDATIIDFGQGYAYGVNAIHIQTGSGTNNEDRRYDFDGLEYAAFPSELATTFISPSDTGIAAKLILFTLDGKVNDSQPIEFAVAGNAYDDDENPTEGSEIFDCYANVGIEEIFGLNVLREESGSVVGHLELSVSEVAGQVDFNETDVSEGGTGDGDRNRRRPVHGWLVQFIAQGADDGDGGPLFLDSGAWGRTLVQGNSPLMPSGTDLPALSAGPPVL